MFRFLFRFTGLVLITLSFLFVVYDGTKSIADQTIYISRVGPTWVNIHPNSLSAFEPAVETLTGAWVWNDLIQPYFLEQPTALVLTFFVCLHCSAIFCRHPFNPYLACQSIRIAGHDLLCLCNRNVRRRRLCSRGEPFYPSPFVRRWFAHIGIGVLILPL